MAIHDTECPYWDQVSLNHTIPTLYLTREMRLLKYVSILQNHVQVNAIDTTVTFKLSDDEIDDMKLSIAKALKWVIRLDH